MTKNANCACRTCGRAFAGVAAFSAHWAGTYADGRYCIDTEGDPRFESEPGIDRISDPDEPTEKPVWGLAGDRARVRAAFATGGRESETPERKT